MPLTKNKSGDRLSSMLSISSSDLTAPPTLTPKESRRASTHDLLLPDRTSASPVVAGNAPNAPWMPPQHQRSSSGQVRRPYNQHLAPLAPPVEIQRKPIGEHFVRDGSSQPSLHPSSATSSPVNTSSRPTSMYSSQPSSPFQPTPPPHSAVEPHSKLSPPGHADSGSPTTGKLKRKSWFGGNKRSKKEEEEERKRTAAWVVGHDHQRTSYDLQPLVNAQRVIS
jgi:hypothetical protein